jgi:iron(II)-dependent oxidoreductase
MATRNAHRTLNVFPETGLPLAGLFLGSLFFLVVVMFILKPVSGFAQSNEVIPEGMAYIACGPTIIGIDKDPSSSTIASNESVTLYQRRMSMPWSKEAFHDEGPAHWVFLDGYFMDKYETSNQHYAEFMKATGHPGPAYWDDPRLNKPNQPVVGVNWFVAKAYC